MMNVQAVLASCSSVLLGSGHVRTICTTQCALGKRNFRKFLLGNKRGTRMFKQQRMKGQHSDIPIETLAKPIGFDYGNRFVSVPEMIPELVVPDLTDCQLKPYVSYKTADIAQDEFTSQDLFDVVYKGKIEQDYKDGKLDEDGNPKEPSKAESLSSEEAFAAARKTGSDIFNEKTPKIWECLEIPLEELQERLKNGFGTNKS